MAIQEREHTPQPVTDRDYMEKLSALEFRMWLKRKTKETNIHDRAQRGILFFYTMTQKACRLALQNEASKHVETTPLSKMLDAMPHHPHSHVIKSETSAGAFKQSYFFLDSNDPSLRAHALEVRTREVEASLAANARIVWESFQRDIAQDTLCMEGAMDSERMHGAFLLVRPKELRQ